MRPRAAGHMTARPPRAPGEMGASGRACRQDQRPGSSAAASPLAPAPARSRPDALLLDASFGCRARTNKTDRRFGWREDGGMWAGTWRRSLGTRTAGPERCLVFHQNDFSLLSRQRRSRGGGGEHRCPGLRGGGVNRELGAREEGHRMWQS